MADTGKRQQRQRYNGQPDGYSPQIQRLAGSASKSREQQTAAGVHDSVQNSPTLTIDTDSFSSIRPHIMGFPGARVIPVQHYMRNAHTPTPSHSPPYVAESPQTPDSVTAYPQNASLLNASTRANPGTPRTSIIDTPSASQAGTNGSSNNAANATAPEKGLRAVHGIRAQPSDRGITQHKSQQRCAANSPLGVTPKDAPHSHLILVPYADTQQEALEANRKDVLLPDKPAAAIVSAGKAGVDAKGLSTEATRQTVDSTVTPTSDSNSSEPLRQNSARRGDSISNTSSASHATAIPAANKLDTNNTSPVAQLLVTSNGSTNIPTIQQQPSSAPQPTPSIITTSSSPSPSPSTSISTSTSTASGVPTNMQTMAKSTRRSTSKRRASESDDDKANDRPIATPKSRLSKLRPAHKQMPTSKQVAEEADQMYTKEGYLIAKRPSGFILRPSSNRSSGPHTADLNESYFNDPGYDLVYQDITGSFCGSFDIDLLPDAPPRKLDYYNLGVKDVPVRTPTPATIDKEAQGRDTVGDSRIGGDDGREGKDASPSRSNSPARELDDQGGKDRSHRNSNTQQTSQDTGEGRTIPAAPASPKAQGQAASEEKQQGSSGSGRGNDESSEKKHALQPEEHAKQRNFYPDLHLRRSGKPVDQKPPVAPPLHELQPNAQRAPLPHAAPQDPVDSSEPSSVAAPLPKLHWTLDGRQAHEKLSGSGSSTSKRSRHSGSSTAGKSKTDGDSLQPSVVSTSSPEPQLRRRATAAAAGSTARESFLKENPRKAADKGATIQFPAVLPKASKVKDASSIQPESAVEQPQPQPPTAGTNRPHGREKKRFYRSIIPRRPLWPFARKTRSTNKAGTSASSGANANTNTSTNAGYVAAAQAQNANAAAGSAFLPSITSSWGHLYRQRPPSMATSRRSARVRDVVTYPFHLGYNCILWWIAPCVRE
ncbi:hypothetical protein GGI12_003969 [Dipsacomyces acuminosporus]|nr:hypothetical protein GGI12_003969 [Dipsacomyces acuminosporus]